MFLFFPNQTLIKVRYLWDLFYELVRRDLKVQYEGTLLGFAWTLINPFLQLGIFYFLFKIILGVQTQRFTSFAFIGIIAYTWFQSSLSQASQSASGNRDIALRPAFPIALLPFIAIGSTMLHFIFTLPLLFTMVFIDSQRVSSSLLLLPIVMAVQFILSLGFGYLFAILNLIFRDTKYILDVLLRLFYFVSPVFYDPHLVPQNYRWLYDLNPMVTILHSYREIIMFGTMTQGSQLLLVAIFSIFLAMTGLLVFQRQSYRFLEQL